MRLFLAINLPDDVRLAAHAAVAPLRQAAPAAGWVDPSRLHLTLKFLGEVPDAAAARVAAAMERAAAPHAPLELVLGGVGAFPSLRDPRIVWLGVAGSERLAALHRDVEAECATLGYEREHRPFRPHVTLARMKGGGATALAALAAAVQFQATAHVETIDLMESRLAGTGPRYAVRASARLRTA